MAHIAVQALDRAGMHLEEAARNYNDLRAVQIRKPFGEVGAAVNVAVQKAEEKQKEEAVRYDAMSKAIFKLFGTDEDELRGMAAGHVVKETGKAG